MPSWSPVAQGTREKEIVVIEGHSGGLEQRRRRHAAPGDETGRSSPSSSRFLPGHLVAHFQFRGPSADLSLRDYQKLQVGETKIFHQCGAGARPAVTSAIRRLVPPLVASGS